MTTRHRIHANPFSIRGPVSDPQLIKTLHQGDTPLAVDIGFGAGAFLLDLAATYPKWNIVGFEIRQHFVDDVLKEAKKRDLTNLYALRANANIHTTDILPDNRVVFVSVNFPDPWFKKRHHKRRVIDQNWIETLMPKLKTGAVLHVMTDFSPIAHEASLLLENNTHFKRCHQEPFDPTSTTGIISERERTHTKRGEPIYRLAYRYINPHVTVID